MHSSESTLTVPRVASAESPILLEKEGDVLWITFNRPEQRNVVDLAMAARMRELGQQIANERDIKVIVLRARGAAFMAGGDITSFQVAADDIGTIIDGFHAFIRALADSPAAVVASVQGAAAGGGLSLALNADFVLASEAAKFSFAYRYLGTSPDGGCTYFLPRLVGNRKAFELLTLGEAMSARQALAMGLINEIVPNPDLEKRMRAVVDALRSNAAEAAGRVRRLLMSSQHNSLDEQLDAERESFLACSATTDFREGVTAFLEKRPPRFSTSE